MDSSIFIAFDYLNDYEIVKEILDNLKIGNNLVGFHQLTKKDFQKFNSEEEYIKWMTSELQTVKKIGIFIGENTLNLAYIQKLIHFSLNNTVNSQKKQFIGIVLNPNKDFSIIEKKIKWDQLYTNHNNITF